MKIYKQYSNIIHISISATNRTYMQPYVDHRKFHDPISLYERYTRKVNELQNVTVILKNFKMFP